MKNSTAHKTLTVENWSEQKFQAMKSEWDELLSNSDADPLFMSWNWLFSWWKVHHTPSSKLCIFAVYDDKKLIALAPLYLENSSYFKGLLPTRRLQFIGKRFMGNSGVRAEYMNYIVRTEHQQKGLLKLLEAINDNTDWSELSLSDCDTTSLNSQQSELWLLKQGWHRRVDGKGFTYVVDCTKNFNDYLQSLGKNTRLKLYNRRKLLEAKGNVTIEFMDNNNQQTLFDLLNQWHLERWGSPAIDKLNHDFFEQAFGFSADKLNLNFSSILKLDDKPLSVMLNAFKNGKIYNIQLGYIENFDKKIALGTLHLGYMLEYAFSHTTIKVFDFLEGGGKNSNYKSHMASPCCQLESSRYFRSRLLDFVFRYYDRFFRQPE